MPELPDPDIFGATAEFTDRFTKSGQPLPLADIELRHADEAEAPVAETPEIGRRIAAGGKVVHADVAAHLRPVPVADRHDRDTE